ncbi:MAG: hypothetical protein M1834_000960 [Cirrosporium novae-zelandiae]|nr:MAG: hypothetical protein M1834_000960 [Cirrosporium novae-zelandiae]
MTNHHHSTFHETDSQTTNSHNEPIHTEGQQEGYNSENSIVSSHQMDSRTPQGQQGQSTPSHSNRNLDRGSLFWRVFNYFYPRSDGFSDMAQHVVDIEHKYQRQDEDFQNLVQNCNALQQKLEETRDMLYSFRHKYSEATTTIDRLKKEIQEQELQVKGAQDIVFSLQRSQAPQALDDDMVRQKLRIALAGLKPWAKKYAITSLSDIKQKHNNEAGRSVLSQMSNTSKGHPGSILHKSHYSKAGAIFLTMLLADFICESIIRRPFFFLHEERSSITLRSHGSGIFKLDPPPGEALEAILTSCRPEDNASTQIWRSDTLRLLDPFSDGKDDTAKKRAAGMTERKESQYRKLVREFLTKSQGRFFIKDISKQETQECNAGLLSIFHAVGDVFTVLQRQRVEITPHGLYTLGCKNFQSTSPLMQAHAAHLLDENDTRLDGKPIQMVVQPAILAWGTEAGKDYDQYKVWAKAVVWVLDDRVKEDETDTQG